jgi:hypothetical protein
MMSSSKLECSSHCSGAYEKVSLEQFSTWVRVRVHVHVVYYLKNEFTIV